MRTIGAAKKVGRVTIQFEVANSDDFVRAEEGIISPDQIRRMTITGVVDPGAAMLVLPQRVVKELGLPPKDNTIVRYADGRRAERRQAGAARVEIFGRYDTFTAVVKPKRTTALIGAIVLEALDLLVDCRSQCVIPRDPQGPIYEID